jgi:hypothetical protein
MSTGPGSNVASKKEQAQQHTAIIVDKTTDQSRIALS